MISLAGTITAGLLENNGSLPPGLGLSHLWADCQETEISFMPNARIRVWDYFTYLHEVHYRQEQGHSKTTSASTKYSNCSKCRPIVWTHAWSRFLHWYWPCQRWSIGSQPQTLTTSGFSSGRVLASCIRAPARCCCCHGNCAVGTQPISSFSNAVNLQLNADASREKIIHNGPNLMKLYQPVLGVRFI